MRLYVAAPLFTEAERAFNLVLARALEAEDHQVYLPQRDTPETQAADQTTSIVYANLAALRKADAIVAVCDGSRSTTAPRGRSAMPTVATFKYSACGRTRGSCSDRTSKLIS